MSSLQDDIIFIPKKTLIRFYDGSVVKHTIATRNLCAELAPRRLQRIYNSRLPVYGKYWNSLIPFVIQDSKGPVIVSRHGVDIHRHLSRKYSHLLFQQRLYNGEDLHIYYNKETIYQYVIHEINSWIVPAPSTFLYMVDGMETYFARIQQGAPVAIVPKQLIDNDAMFEMADKSHEIIRKVLWDYRRDIKCDLMLRGFDQCSEIDYLIRGTFGMICMFIRYDTNIGQWMVTEDECEEHIFLYTDRLPCRHYSSRVELLNDLSPYLRTRFTYVPTFYSDIRISHEV